LYTIYILLILKNKFNICLQMYTFCKHLYTIFIQYINGNNTMTSISVRLSEDETAYLEAISRNKKISKSNKQSSPGRTLKRLIKWCADNQIDISSSYEKPENSSKKLLEQLHVSLPHVLYLLRLNLLLDSSKIPDEAIAKAKQQAIDYINSVCGDFQHVEYSEINAVGNEIGLKQLPVEKDRSAWKNSK